MPHIMTTITQTVKTYEILKEGEQHEFTPTGETFEAIENGDVLAKLKELDDGGAHHSCQLVNTEDRQVQVKQFVEFLPPGEADVGE